MRRRTVLASIGALSTGLAGCFTDNTDQNTPDRSTETPDDENDSSENGEKTPENSDQEVRDRWHSEVIGWVGGVAQDTLFVEESFNREERFRQLHGFNTETGEIQWTYGEIEGYDSYMPFGISDAIYAGYADDVVGSGTGHLVAIEFDGEERWRRKTGSIGHRPQFGDGFVSVGSDDGVVRAFERETGELRWKNDDLGERKGSSGESSDDDPDDSHSVTIHSSVVAIDDLVYVNTTGIYALDPDDGTVEWQYGNWRDSIQAVEDGVAYVTGPDWIGAIENGEPRWQVELSDPTYQGIESENVIVTTGEDTIRALDAASGTEQWQSRAVAGESYTEYALALQNERLYLIDDQLVIFDVSDGTEITKTDLDVFSDHALEITVPDDSRTQQLIVESKGTGDDTRTRLFEIAPTGAVTWTETFGVRGTTLVTDNSVYIGAKSGVHAFSRTR